MVNAQPGDMIVLLGKGHEDYQEIRGVKYHFDEREAVAEILEEIKERKTCTHGVIADNRKCVEHAIDGLEQRVCPAGKYFIVIPHEVNESGGNILNTITVEELAQNGTEGLQLIDVRPENDFSHGRSRALLIFH